MELIISTFLVATLVIFLSLFWFRLCLRNQNKTKLVLPVLPLPPGTTGWPILGENIEYFLMGRKGTPEKFIEDRMNKYSSQAFKTSLIGETMAVLCGPEGNKFIFSNEGDLFHSWWPESSKKIFPLPHDASLYEELKETRSSVRGFLKPEMLNRCTQGMDSLTKQHLQVDLDHDDLKVIMGCDLAKKYTFMFACRFFLNIENPDHVAKLSVPFDRLMAGFVSVHINLPGTPFNRAIKASNFLRNEIVKITKQRKIDLSENRALLLSQGRESDNILSYMLVANDENGHLIDEANIAVRIITLFLAGHDSVSSVIAFTMKYLAELPHIYTEVLKEQMEIAKMKAEGELLNLDDLQKMSYTWNVVNEVMRLAPTLQGTFVDAVCDISYAGFSIPKGWKVHYNAFSTHKNPNYFPEPERFDPSRFQGNGPAPYTFVPFGGGTRICPGMGYARCAILVFLHNLVIRCSWKKLIPHEKIIFDPLPRLANGLPIHLQPHDC